MRNHRSFRFPILGVPPDTPSWLSLVEGYSQTHRPCTFGHFHLSLNHVGGWHREVSACLVAVESIVRPILPGSTPWAITWRSFKRGRRDGRLGIRAVPSDRAEHWQPNAVFAYGSAPWEGDFVTNCHERAMGGPTFTSGWSPSVAGRC
jgi:hypothetical protein